jgi:hypothetical protein
MGRCSCCGAAIVDQKCDKDVTSPEWVVLSHRRNISVMKWRPLPLPAAVQFFCEKAVNQTMAVHLSLIRLSC